jgi:hypothetical protein
MPYSNPTGKLHKGNSMFDFDEIARKFSAALKPHTDYVGKHARDIVEAINELKQESDLGRPDTADQFKFLNFRGTTTEAGPIPLEQLIKNLSAAGGPTAGEVWLLQTVCVNGIPGKSPAFNIRTDTGRLIAAAVAEGTGNENYGGSVVLLQGERLVFESTAPGTFDFTVSFVQRKFPRQDPDAGFGVNQQVFEDRFRGEHERDRDFPGRSYVPGSNQDAAYGGDIGPDSIIREEPEHLQAST